MMKFLRTAVLAFVLSSSAASSEPQTILSVPERPEGITEGPGSTVFVSQILSGQVLSIDVLTGEPTEVVPKQSDNRQAWGLWYYKDSIFVAGGGKSFGDGPANPQVYVYDVNTGKSLANCTPVSQNEFGTFLNDVTVKDGTAYITDSVHGKMMAMDADAAIASGNCAVWEVDLPDNFDPTAVDDFGVNGVVSYQDGLLVCHEIDGSVWYVSDLDNPTSPKFQEVIPDGGAPFADGLTIQDDKLYITQNFEDLIGVYSLEMSDDGNVTATHLGNLTSPYFATPATSAVYENYIYSTNSRFESLPNISSPANDTVIGVLNTFYEAAAKGDDVGSTDESSGASTKNAGVFVFGVVSWILLVVLAF